MKTIIKSVKHDGKYFYVDACGISFRYIEPDDIMDFLSQVMINAVLTDCDKKDILESCSRRNIKHPKGRKASSHSPDSLA